MSDDVYQQFAKPTVHTGLEQNENAIKVVVKKPPVNGHFLIPESRQIAQNRMNRSTEKCLQKWTNRKPLLFL